MELPGKVLPPMPRKNKQSSVASNLMSVVIGSDDDASSLSSVSTMGTLGIEPSLKNLSVQGEKATISTCVSLLIYKDHRRTASGASMGVPSPRSSMDALRSRGASTPKFDIEVRARFIL